MKLGPILPVSSQIFQKRRRKKQRHSHLVEGILGGAARGEQSKKKHQITNLFTHIALRFLLSFSFFPYHNKKKKQFPTLALKFSVLF